MLAIALAAVLALPYVHAHRGGPQHLTQPAFAEETMPAFRDAWEVQRAVLELDVKLSKDRVPVVIHDHTLDRTTPCTGAIGSKTWDELRAQCPSDVIGVPPNATAKADPPVPMARFTEVLEYARRTGAPLNVEIKNTPQDNDFDATPAYATTIIDEIKASGLPLDQLIIQSFWPPDLDTAEQLLPGVQTSHLTLDGFGPDYAATRGYEWWSPAWPVTADAIANAHASGLKVVPYTLDTPDDVRAAKAAGADAVITNDPTMARQTLGIPGAALTPAPAAPATPRAARRCAAVRGARRITVSGGSRSCAAARRVVRSYLRSGCRRTWRCSGRKRVTIRRSRVVIRFEPR